MEAEIRKFIQQNSFPCIMAKSLLRHGLLQVHTFQDVSHSLGKIYEFIDEFRKKPSRLSSFILCLDSDLTFDEFEKMFWKILSDMNEADKKDFTHDARVASDFASPDFSFSLKSEAFFILALHPQSPRWARRFSRPAIVFNPHVQFEKLRAKGLFTKIRNLIRDRDKLLQGYVNPMLSDFGHKSEIYQYTGRIYLPHESLSL